MMVTVHGISGNALKHSAMFSPTCELHGSVMLAPIFTRDMHPDYQRLGREGRGNRVDLLLHQMLAEVTSLTAADASRIHLFGFSAGAQFAHRYAMVHPDRVARAAVAAAGWYTFPDHRQRFPYGIRPARSLDGVVFNPEAFLRVPIAVLVGELDTATENVRSTERTVKQQGATRLDRARNWTAAMRQAAEAYGLEPQVTLREVPGVRHSFTSFCEHGNLVALVGQALFSEPADADAALVGHQHGNGRAGPVPAAS
jgi:pimeloyl-ACP methyl ester carboxylesterase